MHKHSSTSHFLRTDRPDTLHLLLHAAFAPACSPAVGGVCVHAQTGCAQAAQLGLGSGALLGLSAVAMSDARNSDLGELGVKAAWGKCVSTR